MRKRLTFPSELLAAEAAGGDEMAGDRTNTDSEGCLHVGQEGTGSTREADGEAKGWDSWKGL